MQTLIHADIFFFVTTIIAVLIAIVLIVILIYIAVILSDIKKLSRIVRDEGAEIAGDVHAFREEIKEELQYSKNNHWSTMATLLNFFGSMITRRKSGRHQK